MQNVILVVLLLLALALIAVVLLQRSEGGGLGMGGGGGVMSGRGAATALGKLTWILGIAFMATSLAMTVIAARESANRSVLDRLGDTPATQSEESDATVPAGSDLLPPAAGDAPLTPPRADQ